MVDKLDVNVYLFTTLTFAVIFQNDDKISFLETEWFQSYWTICLPLACLYIAIVAFGGPILRRSKPSCRTRLLRYWNFALTIFSVLGFVRVGGEFVHMLTVNGFVSTFCNNRYFHSRSVYFWYFCFVVSKFWEMGDTLFLMSSGKPVRFIHWFHHTVTMIYSFYIAVYLPAIGRWMSSMNFLVHSLMYFYYFVSSHGVKVPRNISIIITTMQTAQMFLGLGVNVAAFVNKQLGNECINGGYTVEAGIIMYIFYVFLFVNLFYKTYFK